MSTLQLIISDQVHEVTIKEYKSQRVITFRDIDGLHQKPDGTSRRTFNSHKKQFVEGEDYFVLNTYEANKYFGLRAPNGLVVLTESGYLLTVKPFTDDLAWQVQRQLVNAYFKAKEVVPTSQEDIMIYALQSQKEMKAEIAMLKIHNNEQENKIQTLQLVVDNEVWLTENQKSDIQEAVNARVGFLMKKGYEAHFQSIYRALKSHFSVPKYNKIRRADFDIAMDLIRGWYPKKKEEAN